MNKNGGKTFEFENIYSIFTVFLRSTSLPNYKMIMCAGGMSSLIRVYHMTSLRV